jgi:hypothetical protein
LPASQPIENLANVQAIEPEMNFFAHVGHPSLARFVSADKPYFGNTSQPNTRSTWCTG